MTFRCPNGQYYFERIPLSQNIEYHVLPIILYVYPFWWSKAFYNARMVHARHVLFQLCVQHP